MPRQKQDESVDLISSLIQHSDRPRSQQVREALTQFVETARPGLLLPSERVLAEQLGLARMTVRGIVEDLENEGLIRRVPGRGTFVQERRLLYSDIFRSFSEDMRLRGMEPGDREFTVRRRVATGVVAERLEIEKGDPIVYLERIRTADGSPMALERTNLPAARFPGVEGILREGVSLYEVLARSYGVRLESAEQRISIAQLTPVEAEKLEVDAFSPAFLIERRALDNMGNIAEFGRSLYRGDRYAIEMHVRRPAPEGSPTPPAVRLEP